MHGIAFVLANIINPILLLLWLAAMIVTRPERDPREGRRYFIAALIGAVVSIGIAEVLKAVHPWPRLGDEFPSGHEAFAATFATSTAVLSRRWAPAALALAVIMAPVLVEAHFHNWIDVLASAIYCPPVTLAAHRLFGAREPLWTDRNSSR